MAALPKPNTTTFAILGIIAKKPSSGYDAIKSMKASRYHYWYLHLTQIYSHLKVIESLDWATTDDGDETPKSRRVYTITNAGQEQLARWLRSTDVSFSLRDELALRIASGDQCHPSLLIATLEAEIDHLDTLDMSALEEDPEDPYVTIANDWNKRLLEARSAWIQDSIERLQELDTKR